MSALLARLMTFLGVSWEFIKTNQALRQVLVTLGIMGASYGVGKALPHLSGAALAAAGLILPPEWVQAINGGWGTFTGYCSVANYILPLTEGAGMIATMSTLYIASLTYRLSRSAIALVKPPAWTKQ